jgi:hypothetical protein
MTKQQSWGYCWQQLPQTQAMQQQTPALSLQRTRRVSLLWLWQLTMVLQ